MMHKNTKHGSARRGLKTRTYKAWESMIRRCTMPSQESYPIYGGRGISVCARWQSFEMFIEDIGEAKDGESLDRIDPNGNYEPGNCRWCSMKTQQRNRTNNRLIEFDGRILTSAEWSEITGIHSATIRTRLDKYRWTIEKALTTHRGRADAMRSAQQKRHGMQIDRQEEALKRLSDAVSG